MGPYGDRTINGLLAIYLPTAGQTPARLQDNLNSGYAVEMEWKDISEKLEDKIQEAFDKRSESNLIDNTRKRRKNNSQII